MIEGESHLYSTLEVELDEPTFYQEALASSMRNKLLEAIKKWIQWIKYKNVGINQPTANAKDHLK